MQIESVVGKRYAFVSVDNFSGYTLVDFIKEKSNRFGVSKKLCVQLKDEKDRNIGKLEVIMKKNLKMPIL